MNKADFQTSMRKHRLVTCRNFTGLQQGKCAAGISYDDERVRVPHPTQAATHSCVRDERWLQFGAQCPNYVALTEAEIDAQDAEYARAFEQIRAGVSPCCREPVQPMGYGIGCSKCRKLLLTQCEKGNP